MSQKFASKTTADVKNHDSAEYHRWLWTIQSACTEEELCELFSGFVIYLAT